MNNSKVIFVSGIGTNVGKSFSTGWLANYLIEQGETVITQKMIQTGNDNYSEDIDVHRKIMGIEYTEFDNDHTTAPIIFSYPASPHLAAKIDNREIDLQKIEEATNKLTKHFDVVLIEGAGGLMVPIKDFYLTIDYIAEHNYPVALVANGALGSINHTILSIESLVSRNIKIDYLIYNSHFDEDKTIASDTIEYLKAYVSKYIPDTKFLISPTI